MICSTLNLILECGHSFWSPCWCETSGLCEQLSTKLIILLQSTLVGSVAIDSEAGFFILLL